MIPTSSQYDRWVKTLYGSSSICSFLYPVSCLLKSAAIFVAKTILTNYYLRTPEPEIRFVPKKCTDSISILNLDGLDICEKARAHVACTFTKQSIFSGNRRSTKRTINQTRFPPLIKLPASRKLQSERHEFISPPRVVYESRFRQAKVCCPFLPSLSNEKLLKSKQID